MIKNIIRLSSVLWLLSLLTLPASPLWAQGSKQIVRVPISDAPSYDKRALVVGVTDYALAPPLHVCGNDAKEFADLLKTRFGFSDVTLMTDDAGTAAALRPTCNNLRRAVHALLKGIQPGKSEVVLFYSGHGVRLGTDSDWLVPEDGDPQDISHTCLNYTAIVQALNTERPKRAFLVTDACRSLLSGKASGEGSGFGKGLEGLSLGPEVAELLSCQPTEVSQEGLPTDFPESVFTHFLVKGLEGDPDALDTGTKNVTFDSLKVYVQGQVSGYVRSHFNSTQLPDGRATLGRMVLARAEDLPRGVTLPSPSPQTPDVPTAPVASPLTPAQQQANARLMSLWTDSDGTFNSDKAKAMTVKSLQQALDAGANVNVRDKIGTPLLTAFTAGASVALVRLLLDKGADVNAKDNSIPGEGGTALMNSVLNSDPDVARLLLDKGAYVEATNINRCTALIVAAQLGNSAVARILLARGADVNAKCFNGATALSMAKENKHDDVAALLKAAGEKE